MTSGEPPADAAASPALIRDLERRRLRSLVDADLAVARRLHADAYELVTPSGDTLSGDEYLGAIASGALRYTVFEPEDDAAVAVRLFGDGAAVRYIARVVVTFPGGTDDARLRHTDLWERRDGRWQATWSQATRIPNATAETAPSGSPSASVDSVGGVAGEREPDR